MSQNIHSIYVRKLRGAKEGDSRLKKHWRWILERILKDRREQSREKKIRNAINGMYNDRQEGKGRNAPGFHLGQKHTIVNRNCDFPPFAHLAFYVQICFEFILYYFHKNTDAFQRQ